MSFGMRVVVLSALCLVVGGIAFALDETPEATGATKVFIHGPNTRAMLSASLTGTGVEGAESAAALSSSGELKWKQYRDRVDDLGGRHVFYRQVLALAPELSRLVEAPYSSQGVELLGGTIGIHSRDGSLWFAAGAQFQGIALVNQPTIGTARDAYDVTQEAVWRWPEFRPADRSMWSSDLVASQVEATHLWLESTGDGSHFRFVWFVPTLDLDEVPYSAWIDAASGELLSLASVQMTATSPSCAPKGTTQTSAVGLPQNSSMSNRSVWAGIGSNHDGFAYEGARLAADGTVPPIEIYMGSSETGYVCNATTKKYAMVPLNAQSGTVYYDNYTSPITVPGKAAGDAAHFTAETMRTLKSLGWYSYDGAGATARVVVDANYYKVDGGEFVLPAMNADYAPPWAVAVYRRSGSEGRPYWYSSCLDLVAHEWGHGVVQKSADFFYGEEEDISTQLHEGFADVIGYIVEWDRQPQGSGAEQAEWKLGEDNGAPQRRVDDAGGSLRTYYFHKDDHPDDRAAHHRGNQLAVAYSLLFQGDQNPWCKPSCGVTVTGLGKAKATRIFFDTLVDYCVSADGWADLADLAKAAAYARYKKCSKGSSASTEQHAANDALAAIGYPGNGYYFSCP